MADLTINVDDDLLRRARLRALERGTSVNAILRDCLEALAGKPVHASAVARLLDLSRSAASRRARKRWTRDELPER
jgi:plasmid stability protein